LVLRAGLAGGGAPKMTLKPAAVSLLFQVNIKDRWHKNRRPRGRMASYCLIDRGRHRPSGDQAMRRKPSPSWFSKPSPS
jgi:hypothetical protein